MDHVAADYLVLAEAITTTLTAEVARFALDPQAHLDRQRFVATLVEAGFSLADFPLLDEHDSDAEFVDNLELLVGTLTDLANLIVTFGGTDTALADAMDEFFSLPLLPAHLAHPTSR